MQRRAGSQASGKLAVVQGIKRGGARSLAGVTGKGIQLRLRHAWVDDHGQHLRVLREVLFHALCQQRCLVRAKRAHVAHHPQDRSHLGLARVAFSHLLILGGLPLRKRSIIALVVGLPGDPLGLQLLALGILCLCAGSTAAWNVTRLLRHQVFDLHDVAIAVFEATLSSSPNVVASMSLIVALPHQEVQVGLDVLDHTLQEGLVRLAGYWRTVEGAALVTQKCAILANDLHLGCAVVVAGCHVTGNLSLPELALAVSLKILLIPRRGVCRLKESNSGETDFVLRLVVLAASRELALGFLNG
mmetsp:Transcript_27629/g.51834  ORF Transcript_27629/g.51834 Transcript_27629/m.51834 type:complete len:301 (-) Transcript_27629:382-1284(-)